MRTELVDTLIIGGGQAGLAMSHMPDQNYLVAAWALLAVTGGSALISQSPTPVAEPGR